MGFRMRLPDFLVVRPDINLDLDIDESGFLEVLDQLFACAEVGTVRFDESSVEMLQPLPVVRDLFTGGLIEIAPGRFLEFYVSAGAKESV